jgi:hypothetical protein
MRGVERTWFLLLVCLITTLTLVSASGSLVCSDGTFSNLIDFSNIDSPQFYDAAIDNYHGTNCKLTIDDVTDISGIDFEIDKGSTTLKFSVPVEITSAKMSGLDYKISEDISFQYSDTSIVFNIPVDKEIQVENQIVESVDGDSQIGIHVVNYVERDGTIDTSREMPFIFIADSDTNVRLGTDAVKRSEGSVIVNGYLFDGGYYGDVVQDLGDTILVQLNLQSDYSNCEAREIETTIGFAEDSWEKGIQIEHYVEEDQEPVCALSVVLQNKEWHAYDNFAQISSSTNNAKFFVKWFGIHEEQDRSTEFVLNVWDTLTFTKEEEEVKIDFKSVGSEEGEGVVLCGEEWPAMGSGSKVSLKMKIIEQDQEVTIACEWESCLVKGREIEESSIFACGDESGVFQVKDFSVIDGLSYSEGIWSCEENDCLGTDAPNENPIALFPFATMDNEEKGVPVVMFPAKFESYDSKEKKLISYYFGVANDLSLTKPVRYQVITKNKESVFEQGSLTINLQGGNILDFNDGRERVTLEPNEEYRLHFEQEGETTDLSFLDCCPSYTAQKSDLELTRTEGVPIYGCTTSAYKGFLNDIQGETFKPVSEQDRCELTTKEGDDKVQTVVDEEGNKIEVRTSEDETEDLVGEIVDEKVDQEEDSKNCAKTFTRSSCQCAKEEYFHNGLTTEQCQESEGCQTGFCSLQPETPYFCCNDETRSLLNNAVLKNSEGNKDHEPIAAALGYDIEEEDVVELDTVRDASNVYPMSPFYAVSSNNGLHRNYDNPRPGHRWVRCGDPYCAVDVRVGSACSDASTTAALGIPIYATMDGYVVTNWKFTDGSGWMVIITDDGKKCSKSSCPSKNAEVLAHIKSGYSVGSKVELGEEIGELYAYPCGSSTFGPHLHYERKIDGEWVSGDGYFDTWNNQLTSLETYYSAATA